MGVNEKRRQFLQHSLVMAWFPASTLLSGCGSKSVFQFDVLSPADENGLRLFPGFSSRIVARSSEVITSASAYQWHAAPDGAAVFPTVDGGWVYVSNSEVDGGKGGVGAIRFDAEARIVDAYSLLDNTSRNCAGGATPWGTWLSCEEVDAGTVIECDPLGVNLPQTYLALGVFKHEAVAVDSKRNILYLTEDQPDGRFYRFTPGGLNINGDPDLSSGTLEVMEITNVVTGSTAWHVVPDPLAALVPTRQQVVASTAFNGGEGIFYIDDKIYFATKGDNRIWVYDIASSIIEIFYDDDSFSEPVLTGVDNIAGFGTDSILVAEDGGDMQIVLLGPGREPKPILQIVNQDASEITGPAFDPSFQRLYFSSQKGPSGRREDGITYEVTGPFHKLLSV